MSDSYFGIIQAVNNLRLANGATPKEYSPSFQGIAEAIVDIKREWGGGQPGVYPPGWATSTDDNGVVTGDFLYAPKVHSIRRKIRNVIIMMTYMLTLVIKWVCLRYYHIA